MKLGLKREYGLNICIKPINSTFANNNCRIEIRVLVFGQSVHPAMSNVKDYSSDAPEEFTADQVRFNFLQLDKDSLLNDSFSNQFHDSDCFLIIFWFGDFWGVSGSAARPRN